MKLRPYQQQAVQAAVTHFKQSQQSAVLVMPTGSGKSLVIAKLAAIANGRVLVLTHVKELVAQNAEKIASLTDKVSIFSAGLGQKSLAGKTVVASIQSAFRQELAFEEAYTLLIIDECHRISSDVDSQYQVLMTKLRLKNPKLRVLGLTATPYRLGTGWIYRHHYHGKIGNDDEPVFEQCIFDLPLRPLIKEGYLTKPRLFDGLSAQYDFDSLSVGDNGGFNDAQVNTILNNHGRATQAITRQILELGVARQGVIIFAATVRHGQEILALCDKHSSSTESDKAAFISAETPGTERDQIILAFKARQIKYLINVSVLTTGFDAPHVDLIAILRPTASVSLFQQMIGRGLRIAPEKKECLIIDYAANGFSLYFPEVGQVKGVSKSVPVQIPCPKCEFANVFWGLVDADGAVIEHFGRRCQGLVQTSKSPKQQCDFRFRSRVCPDCGTENDIAARICHHCDSTLVDPDKHLKKVLAGQQHHLFRCQDMILTAEDDTLLIRYLDIDGNDYCRRFKMQTQKQRSAVYALFIYPHSRTPGIKSRYYQSAIELVKDQNTFRKPDLLLLKKRLKGWRLMEMYFDYQGRYQTEKTICNP